MKKKFLKYLHFALQVIIITTIVLLAFLVIKGAFDLHSYWTPIIVAVVTTTASIIMNIGIEKRKKHTRNEKLENLWKKAEDINFGINGYAFYDHEDCGYVDNLIMIRLLNEKYVYDFNKPFSENAKSFPKLQQIQDLFADKFSLSVKELDQLVTNIIDTQHIQEDLYETLLLYSIAKSRKDTIERLEASNLLVELIESNIGTKKLIDAIFAYLKTTYPDIIEASYKTNSKPENKKNFIDDFVCLSTSVGLYGCLIKQEGGNIENSTYYLHKTPSPFGIRLQIQKENAFPDVNEREIYYDTLALLIDEQIKSFGISLEGKKHFTDVIFEFDKGLKCYLLYSAQPDKPVSKSPDFSIIYENKQFAPIFLAKAVNTEDPKLEFYLCYAQSIIRKYINKRFK